MAKLRNFGVVGALVAGLLCFTPLLVVALSAVGLGWLSGYSDYVLLPALLIFAGITVYAWRRIGPTTDSC